MAQYLRIRAALRLINRQFGQSLDFNSYQLRWNGSFAKVASRFKNVQQPHLKAIAQRRPLRSWDLVTTVLIFFGVIEDLEKTNSPLILNIKRGILAKQRKEYLKADIILHSALMMAQELSDTDAETYIFDVMADNFFEWKSYNKAKDLYLAVISRLQLKEDFSFASEELVELSIKLAYCYSKLGQFDGSEKGFQFSIDTQLARTDKFWNNKLSTVILAEGKEAEAQLNDEQKNSLALLGMSYDYYSKHLQRWTDHLDYALGYRKKALEISKVINGPDHEQTLVLENDIADLYLQQEKYDKAKEHLRNAIKGAREAESAELPVYYLNMASLHYHQNRSDLAQGYCRKSLDFLNRSKTEIHPQERKELLEKSENCLKGDSFTYFCSR